MSEVHNLVPGKIKIFRQPTEDSYYDLSQLMTDNFSQRQLQNIRGRVVLLQAYWIKDNRKIGSVPYSTAFLLQNGLVLTAAHNIYMESRQLFASYVELELLPFDASSNKLHKVINKNQKINKVKIFLKDGNYRCDLETNSQKKKIYKYDIALIYCGQALKLPSETNLQDQVKLMEDYQSMGNESNYVFGFPDLISDESEAFKRHKGYTKEKLYEALLKEDMGKVKKTANNFIYYQIKTVSGQSGAPIFVKLKKRFYLIGVHTSFHIATGTGRGVYFNYFITSLLARWAAELECPLNQSLIQHQSSDLPSYVSFSQMRKDEQRKSQYDSLLNSNSYTSGKSVLNSLCELQDRLSEISQKISAELSVNSIIKISSMKIEMKKLQKSLNDLELKLESSISPKKGRDSSLSFVDRKNLQLAPLSPPQQVIPQTYSIRKSSQFAQLKLKEQHPLIDYSFLEPKAIVQTEYQQDICQIHGEKKLYFQLHHSDKLCFKCLRDKRHEGKEVLCPIHLERIQFLDVKKQISQQKYLCSACMEDYPLKNRIDVLRVDQTHKQVAEYIVLDKDSINRNDYFRCHYCMKESQSKSNAIKLDRQVIEQLFSSSEKLKNSQIIDESLSKLIECLTLPYLEKLKAVFDEKGQKLISFVDILRRYIHHVKLDSSYDILCHGQNPKTVKTQMQKLYFLREELVNCNLADIQNVMIRISLLVKQESQQLYKSIATALNIFISKLEDIFPKSEKISLFSVKGKLKSDYKRVVNKTKRFDYQIRPFLMRNISPYLYGKIKHLEIVKDFQEENEETAVSRRKQSLRNTWVDIYKSYNINKKSSGEKLNFGIQSILDKIFVNLNLSREQLANSKQVDEDIKEMVRFGMRCHLLSELNRQVSKQDFHSLRLSNFGRDLIQPVTQRIMQLPNLKSLVLVYDHFLCSYDLFQYSITYYEFLSILLCLKDLQRVKIYGIKIKHIGKMVRQLYKNKENYKEIIESLTKRQMHVSLRIQFHIRNCFDVEAISFFCSMFKTVLNVTLIMDFHVGSLGQAAAKGDGTKPGNEEIQAEIEAKLRLINSLVAEGKYLELRDGVYQYVQHHIFSSKAIKVDDLILERRRSISKTSQQTKVMCSEDINRILSVMKQSRISFQGSASSLVTMLPQILKEHKSISSLQIADFCFSQLINDSLAKYINQNVFKQLSIKRSQNVNIEKISKRNLVQLELMFIKFANFEEIAPQSVLSGVLLNSKQLNCLKLQSIYLQEKPRLISLQQLNNIKHLIIIDCPWMNDEIFATISPKSYQKVESLRLVGCPQITDKTIDETVMNFIELSGLDIGNSSINPERLLLLKSKNLSRLCLENCKTATNKIMLAINKKWPTITHLNIYQCPNVTQSVLEVGFKQLQFLMIEVSKLHQNLQRLRYRGVTILPNIYEVKRRLGSQSYDLI